VNLDIAQILISKIDAKKETRFKDPFIYNPNLEEEGLSSPATEDPPKPLLPSHHPLPSFKYVVGAPIKDSDGGDAGILPKRGRYYPHVHFIRSKCCATSY